MVQQKMSTDAEDDYDCRTDRWWKLKYVRHILPKGNRTTGDWGNKHWFNWVEKRDFARKGGLNAKLIFISALKNNSCLMHRIEYICIYIIRLAGSDFKFARGWYGNQELLDEVNVYQVFHGHRVHLNKVGSAFSIRMVRCAQTSSWWSLRLAGHITVMSVTQGGELTTMRTTGDAAYTL